MKKVAIDGRDPLIDLVEQVAEDPDQELVLTRGGKSVVRVVAIEEHARAGWEKSFAAFPVATDEARFEEFPATDWDDTEWQW
jgi:antitoxin (DNA-binding transcriptional repressor) of toxin-antitoxin stability system